MHHDPRQEEEHLQHAAEHVRPNRTKNNVMTYLVVLFGAAFLLLLLTFFMQRRTSSEALGNQQTITVNAIKSIEELEEENAALQSQIADLEMRLSTATGQVRLTRDELTKQQEQLAQAQLETTALSYLNYIRALYNQQKTTAARSVLTQIESEMAQHGGIAAVLEGIATSPEAREVYDPAEAFRTIAGWLD